MNTRTLLAFSSLSLAMIAGCNKTPAEPTERPAVPRSVVAPVAAKNAGPVDSASDAAVSGDPYAGKPFTLADAAPDLATQKGDWLAELRTSKGSLLCKLLHDKAPITVANFVGLATGKRTWRHPKSGKWVNDPAYDGTTFHRIIPGFMIQGGDALGSGAGEPGYVIVDEIWEGATHDRAGLLCMANRGPNTNGAQFFITDAAAKHLDSSYTIFGECTPTSLISEIASGPARGDRALSPVTIEKVTIKRSGQ